VSPAQGKIEVLEQARFMADVNVHTENWRTLPWKRVERDVRRLQQRIYRAEFTAKSIYDKDPCDRRAV